jgi:UDP-glucose 4-epimerase
MISVVTGGAGFIGSHLVDVLLERGHEVRVIDNLSGGHKSNLAHLAQHPKLTCHWLDINALEPDSAVFKGADYCFHLAGIGDIVPSIEQPIQYMQTNVQGTVRVLEASRQAGIKKLVYASSSSCYGLADTPTREDHRIQPQYPYALSKYLGEQAAFHWHQVYGLPVNAICIFNAYGTRVRTTGAYGAVFGVFLKQKLAGKPFTVVGDGTQTRDFVYVTDVARAFIAAAETDVTGERFNIGAGKPQPVNYLVALLGGEIEYIPKRPGEPDVTFADTAKAAKILGWKPQIPFEEGVQLMLADIEHWRNAPLWDASSIADATQTWFKYLRK